MIKFFRKIRYNLMETGKTGKYFKYAIGEIILVVIGILIALQINNWNENQKGKAELNQYLSTLKQNIESDIIVLDSLVKRREVTVAHCKKEMLNFLNKTFNFNDTRNALYAYQDFYFKPNVSGYDALKSSKYLGEINGTTISNLLIDYYARTYKISEYEKSFNEFLETIEAQQAYNYDRTLIKASFQYDSEELEATKTSEQDIYEVFKERHETAAFRSIVSQAVDHESQIIVPYKGAKTFGLNIIKEIDKMIKD